MDKIGDLLRVIPLKTMTRYQKIGVIFFFIIIKMMNEIRYLNY